MQFTDQTDHPALMLQTNAPVFPWHLAIGYGMMETAGSYMRIDGDARAPRKKQENVSC